MRGNTVISHYYMNLPNIIFVVTFAVISIGFPFASMYLLIMTNTDMCLEGQIPKFY
jgi:hypothetical protein